MKQIFTSRSLAEVDMVKSLLESDGIQCTLRNEYIAHTAAAGFGFPMAFAWPEIWIDDDDFQRAQEIVQQFRADRPETTTY